ncbi:histidine kinase [Ruania suaedae]|uniref:sensor histidine kinase n=1 Tax=Ruania suaedae TaxID=2897774 RepID=UPI001E5D0F0B|nr:histidine kinase [Ruania suaedae]UFU03747.1 histidine kinase [Ruania suaedae]
MTTAARVTRGDLVRGAAVAIASLAMVVLLPAVGRLDPELEVAMPRVFTWPWWAALAAILAQGAWVTWLSAAPRRALVAVAALAFAVALVPLGDAANIPLIAVIVAAYASARRREPEQSWSAWILTAALVAAASTVATLRLEESLLLSVTAAIGQAIVVVGVPAAVAAAVSVRAQMRASRDREALARSNEAEARTEAALAAERTAIARELHDIAAHHLSGIALMSSAISQQIDTDPTTAKAGLADVRAQTRELLEELRGLVALLRQDGVASTDVESLSGLETLIPAAAERGLDVQLIAGTSMRELARGIGPLGQFAAYRTVQEALANAARHAPGGRCTVELADAGEALEIVVTNGRGSGEAHRWSGESGFGLRGMQERATLTRSRLTYGPTDDGGWRVRLRVPRESGHLPPPEGEA